MKAISSLEPPVWVIFAVARHFIQAKAEFWRLLIYATIQKICRFVAFLLPFKALMLAIRGEEILELAGLRTDTRALAAAILALATLAFATHWWFRRSYEKILARQFDHRLGEEEEPAVGRDPVAERLLKSTVSFFSASVIAGLLILALVILFPTSLGFVLPLGVIQTAVLSQRLDPERTERFDVSLFNALFSFTAMAGILVLLAGFVAAGVDIGVLIALFVFIATRQVFASLGEIIMVLFRNRSATLPTLMRRENDSAPAPRVLPVPAHLRRDTHDAWVEDTLRDVLKAPVSVHKASWWQFRGRAPQAFRVEADIGGEGRRAVLLSIYAPSLSELWARECAFIRSAPVPSLAPSFLAARWTSEGGIAIFDLHHAEMASTGFFVESSPEILARQWSADPEAATTTPRRDGEFLDTISASVLETLHLVASTPAERKDIDGLLPHLEALRSRVASLPRGLHNSQIASPMAARCPDGSPRIVFWGQVEIEPIGCQLMYMPAKASSGLPSVVNRLQRSRSDCRDVTETDLRLAAALYGLSRHMSRSRLNEALLELRRAARLCRSKP